MGADWVSALGTIFAAAAAIFAIIQTKISLDRQQIQQHKSVIPIPQIVFGDYTDRLFVKLKNAGIGPMPIQEVLVRDESRRLTKRSVIDLKPTSFTGFSLSTLVGNIDGRTVSEQDVLLLLHSEGGGHEHALIRAWLGNLSVTIKYTDVYGNAFPVYSRDFTWLQRDLRQSKTDPIGYPQPAGKKIEI